MKVIELIEVNEDPYSSNMYSKPNGAYLTPNGIVIVCGGTSTVANYTGWQALVRESAQGGNGGASALNPIDVHRLIDQISAIHDKRTAVS